jgi:hypothetical protein
MGTRGSRSVFAAALCAGVAMVGVSVHGLLGIDAELQRSAFAAQQQHSVEYQPVHAVYQHRGDCQKSAAPAPSQRT